MKPGTMIKLDWVSDITMEQSMMSRHQHKPAASTELHSQQWPIAPQM